MENGEKEAKVTEAAVGATLKEVAPMIRIEQWQEAFLDAPIFFQVYHMNDSYFIWVGSNPASLTNLNVAIPTKFDSVPSVSSVLGFHTEGTGRNIAQRISKRLNKPVFLSFTPEKNPPMLEEWTEKRIVDRLKAKS